ncbi:E1A [Squirrel monkey adenovirus]|nr:E1A [Squirrel monkey adenovirus]
MRTLCLTALEELELIQEVLDDLGEGGNGGEQPSLSELFDVEWDGVITNQHGVDAEMLFPEDLFPEQEEPDSTSGGGEEDENRELHTPSPPVLSPAEQVHREERELEDLGGDIDLRCYERMFSETEDEGEDGGSGSSSTGEQNGFRLDCPPVPGQDCLSCHFHRCTMGDPTLHCSLCYIRLTNYCIYSPVSEPEEEEETEGAGEPRREAAAAASTSSGVTHSPQKRPHPSGPSPPNPPPHLQSVCEMLGGNEEPLDLSCKRARQS